MPNEYTSVAVLIDALRIWTATATTLGRRSVQRFALGHPHERPVARAA